MNLFNAFQGSIKWQSDILSLFPSMTLSWELCYSLALNVVDGSYFSFAEYHKGPELSARLDAPRYSDSPSVRTDLCQFCMSLSSLLKDTALHCMQHSVFCCKSKHSSTDRDISSNKPFIDNIHQCLSSAPPRIDVEVSRENCRR